MSHVQKRLRWLKLMALWRQSDSTIAVFCHQHRVSVPQFYYWRTKLAKKPAPTASQQLVPVVLQPSTPAIHLTLRLPNGVAVEGLDIGTLTHLLPQVAAL